MLGTDDARDAAEPWGLSLGPTGFSASVRVGCSVAVAELSGGGTASVQGRWGSQGGDDSAAGCENTHVSHTDLGQNLD